MVAGGEANIFLFSLQSIVWSSDIKEAPRLIHRSAKSDFPHPDGPLKRIASPLNATQVPGKFSMIIKPFIEDC
jgi:hypothetical protein